MEYFERDINVTGSQVKASRRYKEISNFFKQIFRKQEQAFPGKKLALILFQTRGNQNE